MIGRKPNRKSGAELRCDIGGNFSASQRTLFERFTEKLFETLVKRSYGNKLNRDIHDVTAHPASFSNSALV